MAEPGTSTGTPGDWWTVFALVPDVLEHCNRGFALYRSPKRKLDPVLRELAQTRVGWAKASQFVFSQHCKSLRGLNVVRGEDRRHPALAGGRPATTRRSARCWPTPTAWRCRPAARRTPVFDALKAFLSDEEILELTYITCLYDMHAVMSQGAAHWSGTTATTRSSRWPRRRTSAGEDFLDIGRRG